MAGMARALLVPEARAAPAALARQGNSESASFNHCSAVGIFGTGCVRDRWVALCLLVLWSAPLMHHGAHLTVIFAWKSHLLTAKRHRRTLYQFMTRVKCAEVYAGFHTWQNFALEARQCKARARRCLHLVRYVSCVVLHVHSRQNAKCDFCGVGRSWARWLSGRMFHSSS